MTADSCDRELTEAERATCRAAARLIRSSGVSGAEERAVAAETAATLFSIPLLGMEELRSRTASYPNPVRREAVLEARRSLRRLAKEAMRAKMADLLAEETGGPANAPLLAAEEQRLARRAARTAAAAGEKELADAIRGSVTAEDLPVARAEGAYQAAAGGTYRRELLAMVVAELRSATAAAAKRTFQEICDSAGAEAGPGRAGK